MRDQALEQRIQDAVDHAVPDSLERILSSCETQKGIVIPMKETKKPKKRWLPLAVAAALAITCVAFGLTNWRAANTVTSVVSLDVNPSIQLQINEKEKVLSAQPLNEDAQTILADMDLKGTQLNVAVNAIIGSLLQHGYLDSISSAILISVEDNDTQRASRLESSLTAEVDAALYNASAGAAVLSQVVTQDAALEAQAQASQISVGKAAMIQQVQALNSSLSFDDLAALSVEELDQLQKTGAPALPIGTTAAAAAAQAYAGLTDANVIARDIDPELDENPAHYEVELKTASGEFDYDVDAYTGEILKGRANVLESSGTATVPSTGTPSTSAKITETKAQSIALQDAGVSTADALGLRVKLDWEDGTQVYEVEFRAGGLEYEYEISALDGTIRKAERDRDDDVYYNPTTNSTSAPTDLIGEAAAKSAALQHAGVSESDASFVKVKLDEDDGIYLYEVEFQVGRTEYEYEIHASTGSILKAETDWDD